MCVVMGRHIYVRIYRAALNIRSYKAAFVCAYLWDDISMCVPMGRHIYVLSYRAAFVCA